MKKENIEDIEPYETEYWHYQKEMQAQVIKDLEEASA